MKFINTLEENGGAGGGVEKVSLGSWLNPGQSRRGHRVRGVRVGALGLGAGGMEGGREGWKHKPVQLTKSFIPRWGREQGMPVFYGGEVLSFHSQSFRSVSETKERKRTTKQQTCYI